MSETYTPGRLVWFELSTDDPDGAARFYEQVLGWKTQTVPMGEGSTYTMFHPAGGKPHSGISEPHGPQAHWMTYVSVDDVDAVVARAQKAGGAVVMPAMDVPGVGRMAGIADKEGAVLMAFRAAEGDGEEQPTGDGDFLWADLICDDPPSAAAWYRDVFGWDSVQKVAISDELTAWVLSRDGVPRAATVSKPMADMPSHWIPFVSCADVDGALDRAIEAGGVVPIKGGSAGFIEAWGGFLDPAGAPLLIARMAPGLDPRFED